MGRPTGGGGGGGGGTLFTSNITQSGSYGTADYIDFGLIITGSKFWFGTCQFASPDKTGTFEVRSNLSGKSSGTDADTKLHGSISASPRSGTVTLDLYKSGTLITQSIISTGVEKVWIKAKSKTATAGSYYASVNYTLG